MAKKKSYEFDVSSIIKDAGKIIRQRVGYDRVCAEIFKTMPMGEYKTGNTVLLDELQRYLNENDWASYTRACSRHNLIPSSFMKYLEENYNCKQTNESSLYIDQNDGNLEFLNGVYLPLLGYLAITSKGSLMGIGRVGLPNLSILIIQMNNGSLAGLEDLYSESLNYLTIDYRIGNQPNTPILELESSYLPNLETLQIGGNAWSSIEYLNRFNFQNLKNLTISSAIQSDVPDLILGEIDWSRYPNLRFLEISLEFTSKNYIVLDRRIESLKKLIIFSPRGLLKIDGNIQMNNLKKLYVNITRAEDLCGLIAPNLTEIGCRWESNNPIPDDINDRIRVILKNKHLIVVMNIPF